MRLVRAVMAASLLALGSCAEVPGGSKGGAVTECHLTPNAPGEEGDASGISTVRTPGVGVYTVRGQVWVQCDTPPEQHLLVLQLQRWVDGWRTMAHETFTGVPGLYWAPRTVSTECLQGQYRLVVDLVGRSSTGVPFTAYHVLSTVNIHDVMCKDNA